jgi:predicted nucleotidyltransferase
MGATWLEQMANKAGERWPALFAARAKTEELLGKLSEGLSEFDDPNYSIVVTGSLGRGEASDKSDVDWILLVDGLSNPDHGPVRQKIAKRIAELGFKEPGRTGTFGNLVTGHELVHYIAGSRDTNENLTRRILLLSESRALTGEVVRERVIGNVLARYVIYDPSVRRVGTHTIPLFLVNDVVRYWRTVASDYASKMWERQHEEWAIRNVKLRFSRKWLFVWGLLASFAGELFPGSTFDDVDDDHERLLRLSNLIGQQTAVAPLDLLARAVLEIDDDSIARRIFSSYDVFLAAITDPANRKALEDLPFEESDSDPLYNSLRATSREFRQGINALFFDKHRKLVELIREYGVF